MLRPCLGFTDEIGRRFRCNALSKGASRCPSCTQANNRAREHRRGTPSQRGYGADWRALRPKILARDKGICRFCGRPGADSVDHVIPKSRGGTDAAENLAAAHRFCNSVAGGSLR